MDEMVDLDDICHFRAEIDAHPSYNEDNFYFSVDLLFADLAAATSENTSLNVSNSIHKHLHAVTFTTWIYNNHANIIIIRSKLQWKEKFYIELTMTKFLVS